MTTNMSTSSNGVDASLSRTNPWRRLAGALNTQWLIVGGCLLAVAYLSLMPLGFLLWQSFF